MSHRASAREPSGASRSADWLDRLRAADRSAPTITVDGLSAERLAARARCQLVDRSVRLGCLLTTGLLLLALLRPTDWMRSSEQAPRGGTAEASWASTEALLSEVQSSLRAWIASSEDLASAPSETVAVPAGSSGLAATSVAAEGALAATFFVAHRRAFEGDERALDQVREIARAFPATRTGQRASHYLASLNR